MSNYRHFAEVHADLKLQIQEEIRVFHLNLYEIKEKQRSVVKSLKWKEVL